MSVEAPDQLNGHAPPAPRDIRFRPGKGGELDPEWAAHMLHLWWTARDSKLTFAAAVQATSLHFLMGDQP